MGESKVAILKTGPDTVLADYGELMHLAGYEEELDPSAPTALKVNISWHRWFPACSTTPWQLEGVTWSYLASIIYHDRYWYPLKGKGRARAFMGSPWGELFQSYGTEGASDADDNT